MAEPSTEDRIVVVPANEASWEDLDAVLGAAKTHGAPCYCQRFKARASEWRSTPDDVRAELLREQTACGHPDSPVTSGLVAYLDDEPVGWCAVEPRTAYATLVRSVQIPWAGRTEDTSDGGVWAVTCTIVRPGIAGAGSHTHSPGRRSRPDAPRSFPPAAGNSGASSRMLPDPPPLSTSRRRVE